MSFQSRAIVLLGAGGHARVVLSVLRACELVVTGCVAPRQPSELWPKDVPWLGDDAALPGLDRLEASLANGIGSVSNVALRRRVYERAKDEGFDFVSIRHPSSVIENDVVLGEGAQVMAGAILQTGARVGANAIVNTGAIVDHDCDIGEHAHIAPGARLSGGVIVGHAAHVGAGAVIIQGVTIGAEAVVGAGAVVLADVEPRMRVAGAPARALDR